MNLLFTALLMLCALGAATFATTTAGKYKSLISVVLGFAAATIFFRAQFLPDAAWIGMTVAVVAALQIFRKDVRWLSPLCAGALGGLWSVLLQIQGLPMVVSIPIAAVVPAAAGYLAARRKAFAPEALREEAMLLMLVLGLAVAIIPEVTSGWQAALALNRDEGKTSDQINANWVLVLSSVSVVLGGLYSLLRRRWTY